MHIGLKGKEVTSEDRKRANLVFVIDVSGSMDMENRLDLVKQALALLVGQLDAEDSVGIVVYGNHAHTILEPTYATGSGKESIMRAVSRLQAEGSTNAQAGLELGYKMAARHLDRDKINRVVLCSDGVANNGITGADPIFDTIREEADQGVTISTVGFGMGNYNDVLMERLADIGNGNYAYVDRIREAHQIFVEELTGTLQVIAKDVKIQVEFDIEKVSRYRLLGFENRMLEKADFDNDAVDAGEIGAGHTVTALYEVKFKKDVKHQGNFVTIRIRHKTPEGETSTMFERQVPFEIVRGDYASASPPAKLSIVVSAFAEKLRGSYWVRNLTYDDILVLWNEIPTALRSQQEVKELHGLVLKAKVLDHRGDKFEADVPVASMDFDHVPVLK
jgi:Ca-activated chloride channel family protein